jgi:EAL domain-containing protein (putative c-di-GMP-specific phosphodiesterase class I)
VEPPAQAEVLRSLGCSEAQGYLYSRPVAAEAYEALLRDQPQSAMTAPAD